MERAAWLTLLVLAVACSSESGLETAGSAGTSANGAAGTGAGTTAVGNAGSLAGSAGQQGGATGGATVGPAAAGQAGDVGSAGALAGTAGAAQAGTSSAAGSGGAAGFANVGDSAGAAGQSNTGGAAGAGEEMDQLPWRALNVTAPPDDYSHVFVPSDADPEAVQQNSSQIGHLDTRVPPLSKLVVDMGSSGGQNLAWFAARGFHFLAVDFMGVNEVPDVVGRSPEFYGDVRLEALTGEDRVPDIEINFHDSFEGHVTYGLAYLHTFFPAQDWGYYLNEDGSVRWSDVIVTGRSHGASSTPRFAKIRRLWRAVSRSGPRDNTCGDDPACSDGIVATWFGEESKTPIDRYFSISGTGDAQFPEIQYALETLGYPGETVNVGEVAPPYNDSHRLAATAGHMGFCDEGAEWDAACNYLFGVPPENQ